MADLFRRLQDDAHPLRLRAGGLYAGLHHPPAGHRAVALFRPPLFLAAVTVDLLSALTGSPEKPKAPFPSREGDFFSVEIKVWEVIKQNAMLPKGKPGLPMTNTLPPGGDKAKYNESRKKRAVHVGKGLIRTFSKRF